MNSPIPSSGLGLAVFAAPVPGDAGEGLARALVLEFDPGGLSSSSERSTFNDDIESSSAIDAKGNAQDARTTAPLRLTRPSLTR